MNPFAITITDQGRFLASCEQNQRIICATPAESAEEAVKGLEGLLEKLGVEL